MKPLNEALNSTALQQAFPHKASQNKNDSKELTTLSPLKESNNNRYYRNHLRIELKYIKARAVIT